MNMTNFKLLDISTEEITETLHETPKILHTSQNGECQAYLKNFDYYHIFCLINTKNPLCNQYIKLPNDFVDNHNSSHQNLLDEF